MSTTDPLAPPNTAPIRLPPPGVDQVVKGNVTIKKLSKYKYRITFSKIGKFLVYQTWDKDNTEDNNSNRFVNYISAKRWVEDFNVTNKNLKQQNKPLFTPTTVIKMQNQNKNYPVVIHKAYMNTSGHVVFTASTKEIKLESNNTSSSKKLIKIPCGKFNNVRFDIDADRNGDGQVYHHSNCSRGNVRSYIFGGDAAGDICGSAWLLPHEMDVVWNKIPYTFPRDSKPPCDYNWTTKDFVWRLYKDPIP